VYSYWVKKKKKQKEACGSNTSRKEDASNLFDNKNQHNNIKEDKATDCRKNTNQVKKKKKTALRFLAGEERYDNDA